MYTEWPVEDTEVENRSSLLTPSQSTELEVCCACFNYAVIVQYSAIWTGCLDSETLFAPGEILTHLQLAF